MAEDVRPIMEREPLIDRDALVMGATGVYSGFLHPAGGAAAHYGVRTVDVLRGCAERQFVAGQEDPIIDVALGLAQVQASP